MKLDPD